MPNNELWEAALAQIQFHISKANFATWLKNTYILEKKGAELTISVPNSFSKEWLENKYNKLIFKILHDLDGEIKEVTYTVKQATKKRSLTPSPAPRIAAQEAQMDFQALNIDRATNLNPRYTLEGFIVGPF
ncbi:MAG TPA: chromosomal replication initiator protein DnaA, partial [candidate division CPR3 bacterium]|nr:chromosomal replication initiator protein DnaA [candidate division CPR3 bacterium]